MLRQRTNSQKPNDEFVARFQQQFPNLGAPGAVSSAAASQPSLAADNHASGQVPTSDRHHVGPEAFRDQDPTPRASDAFRLALSPFGDSSSTQFVPFVNHAPGYYTPTSGGTNTLYHPQAGDLHTPNLVSGLGLNTPLSLPTNDVAIHAGPSGMMDLSHFPPAMPPHQFYPQHFQAHINPFVQQAPQQPTFAPSSFVHHDTGYETMDHEDTLGAEGTVERMGSIGAAFHSQSPQQIDFAPVQPTPAQYQMSSSTAVPAAAAKFRFFCTLHASTAMIKQADEIPVTYLNKGQVYTISIKDTSSPLPAVPGTKYRTFIRISFEDEQQRQNPKACWTLWKDGRGISEAHQRGGRLQAVEHVEAGAQPAESDDRKTRIELESSSFDGFCVTWTPGANCAAECTINVRFNFLSTDFSHSKGVKGIPVRLCAKTSVASTAESPPPDEPVFEICYCKVKLFRDHGAERKLANDIIHVKKTIEKIKSQLQHAGLGGKDFKRGKRGGAHAKAQDHQRSGPGKVPKHKRTWSMSSASSADGGSGGNARSSVEDELSGKLTTLMDMFSSGRNMSILYLRGDEGDDPDTNPVILSGDMPDVSGADSKDGLAWRNRSERNSVAESMASPSPSSVSLQSQATGAAAWLERYGGDESRRMSDQPIKVQTNLEEDGGLSGWIEALGVDPTYKPPVEKPTKAIACFYVARTPNLHSETRELHRAVYLTERTISNFVSRVLAKWNLDSSRFTRAIRVLEGGLEIQMDDDVIGALSEGQAMTLEVAERDLNVPQTNTEWDPMPIEVPDADGNSAHSAYHTATGYELRFSF